MKRILSRPNSPRLLITFVVVGGLVLAYEATTFDLLPWGASAVVNPSAPVTGARLEFSAEAITRSQRREAFTLSPLCLHVFDAELGTLGRQTSDEALKRLSPLIRFLLRSWECG